MTKNLFRFTLAWLLILVSQAALAFSAIAIVEGHFSETWGHASNYNTQQEADKQALASCKEATKVNGVPKLAKQCKIVGQGKGPGYGVIICGDRGCAWGFGYNTAQEAVDAVYGLCSQSYSNCKDKDITTREDFAGFAPPPSQNTATNDCRPRSTSLRCSSSCNNGDCLVTYENGCKIRVQMQPRFNGFTNTWEYPAPNC